MHYNGVIQGGEIRLQSQNTPQILSESEERHFWLNWKLDNAHVSTLQLGRLAAEKGEELQQEHQDEVIIKWPIPVTFTPTKISALMNIAGHQEQKIK